MSLDLWLEADERLSRPTLIRLLNTLGASRVASETGVDQYAYPSGLSACPMENEGNPRIKAEDPRGLNFKVNSRCILRTDLASYDESVGDLKRLLFEIASQTGAYFVVSSQLESALYVHQGEGVEACK